MTSKAIIQSKESLVRIRALIGRHWFVLRGSWPRMAELAYWPTVQVLVWGFMTQYLAGQVGAATQAFAAILSAAILWEVLVRSQMGVFISFCEEIWSRNLGHLFASPLRPIEMAAALMVMGVLRTTIGVLPAAILAAPFFGVDLLVAGPWLFAFLFALLFFGWAVGFAISGMLMRYGLGAESLAWFAVFALLPISAVYYPLAVLTDWLQSVALLFPPAHAFEGLRTLLRGEEEFGAHLTAAYGLNAVALVLGISIFLYCHKRARERGLILSQGE